MTIKNLDFATIAPVLGGSRRGGEFQLRELTVNAKVRAAINSTAFGWSNLRLADNTTNPGVVFGKLVGRTATLRTTIELAPGVRLVLGN